MLSYTAASSTTIKLTLTALFRHSISTTDRHFDKLVEDFSTGYEYDYAYDEGSAMLMDEGEDMDRYEEMEEQKIQLLRAVTGLLVASEFSTLTTRQRDALLTYVYLQANTLGKPSKQVIGDTLLLYAAHHTEVGELYPEGRSKALGMSVLDLAFKYGFVTYIKSRQYRRRLND